MTEPIKRAEEHFKHLSEGLFRASIEYFLETGKMSGSFLKAIESFADIRVRESCKAQREICAKEAIVTEEWNQYASMDISVVDKDSILNAPEPPSSNKH